MYDGPPRGRRHPKRAVDGFGEPSYDTYVPRDAKPAVR